MGTRGKNSRRQHGMSGKRRGVSTRACALAQHDSVNNVRSFAALRMTTANFCRCRKLGWRYTRDALRQAHGGISAVKRLQGARLRQGEGGTPLATAGETPALRENFCNAQRFAGETAVYQAPDAQRVGVLQLFRQRLLGESLEADGAG